MVLWLLPASAQPIQSSTPRRASLMAFDERSPDCAAARWPHNVLVSVSASVFRFWSMHRLLRFDTGIVDDFRPAHDIGIDAGVGFFRRAADLFVTALADFSLQVTDNHQPRQRRNRRRAPRKENPVVA